ncbi:hypothetical protein HNQ36_003535 [Afipia massiliensis]|uniref:Uncharacterized protein n=1 Tax=Afipia massiliensis TaxID=211460 RepID=A0A840MZZ8_9BRAD|nr:hypothetical protein [Afipia massiliensis]
MGTVVDRAGRHAFRKRSPDLFELRGDALRNSTTVLADQKHRGAQHYFLAVQRGSAGSKILALLHIGNVGNPNGHAIARPDDHLLDLLDVGDLSGRAHQILLAVALDIAGADIGVIGSKRGHDVAKAELVGHQLCRIGEHMKLLLEAADGVDFDHARSVSQLRFDDPILNRAQIGRGELLAAGFERSWLGFDRVQIDFSETGRNRAHRRFDTRGQTVLDLLDALIDELSREIDVSAVFEDDGYLAQPVS